MILPVVTAYRLPSLLESRDCCSLDLEVVRRLKLSPNQVQITSYISALRGAEFLLGTK